jgi:hypothetical protein
MSALVGGRGLHAHAEHRPTTPTDRRPVVPVGIFLLAPRRPRTTRSANAPTDWCGIAPHEVAHLIAALVNRRDIVIDLDTHPTITAAARHLGAQPAHLITDRGHRRLRPVPPARPLLGRATGAGLVTARLPRDGVDSADLWGVTRAMQTWRALLRPRGFLLTALTAPPVGAGSVSHRSTVITAARTAGLTWQNEIVVARAVLPPVEPRADPDTAANTPPALREGRHDPAHFKVLVFQAPTGGTDA